MAKWRSYMVHQAPALLDWLQKHHLAPDPFHSRRTRRIGDRNEKAESGHYTAWLAGTYIPSQVLTAPSIRPDTPAGSHYAKLLDDWGRFNHQPQPYGYFDVPHVRYCPRFGVHSSRHGNFIDAYCGDATLKNPKYELSRLALPAIPLSGSLDAGILLIPAWYHNFYHWMVDILPRLQLVKSALAEGLPIIIPSSLSAMQKDMLRQALSMVGFPDAGIVELNGLAYLFRRAILPTRLSRQLDPSDIERNFLRAMAPPPRQDDPKEKHRIYISRKDAAIRRIVNEAEIEAVLSPRGFRTVTLSGLSFEDQARLFRNAEAIVGHHGAAFANLAFCEPGTMVMEIFQQGHFTGTYARMAQLGDLHYGFNTGEARNGDTWLDPAELDRTLNAAGI